MKDGNIYYNNITLNDAGGKNTPGYTYYIWANDTSGKENTSEPQPEFDLPLNEDINEDGSVHFLDLIAVSLAYNDAGANGWVREDVNNDGVVHFMDLVQVSLAYNEEW